VIDEINKTAKTSVIERWTGKNN